MIEPKQCTRNTSIDYPPNYCRPKFQKSFLPDVSSRRCELYCPSKNKLDNHLTESSPERRGSELSDVLLTDETRLSRNHEEVLAISLGDLFALLVLVLVLLWSRPVFDLGRRNNTDAYTTIKVFAYADIRRYGLHKRRNNLQVIQEHLNSIDDFMLADANHCAQ